MKKTVLAAALAALTLGTAQAQTSVRLYGLADAFAGMRKRAIFAPRFLDDALRLFREDAAGYYGELVWIVTMLEMWLASHE